MDCIVIVGTAHLLIGIAHTVSETRDNPFQTLDKGSYRRPAFNIPSRRPMLEL